jgi:hypothetical protein
MATKGSGTAHVPTIKQNELRKADAINASGRKKLREVASKVQIFLDLGRDLTEATLRYYVDQNIVPSQGAGARRAAIILEEWQAANPETGESQVEELPLGLSAMSYVRMFAYSVKATEAGSQIPEHWGSLNQLASHSISVKTDDLTAAFKDQASRDRALHLGDVGANSKQIQAALARPKSEVTEDKLLERFRTMIKKLAGEQGVDPNDLQTSLDQAISELEIAEDEATKPIVRDKPVVHANGEPAAV